RAAGLPRPGLRRPRPWRLGPQSAGPGLCRAAVHRRPDRGRRRAAAAAGAGGRLDGRPVRAGRRGTLAGPVPRHGAGRHHPALGSGWHAAHPRLHQRLPGRLRLAGRGRRRDRRLPARARAQERGGPARGAAPGRRRPLAVALGPPPGGRAGTRRRAPPGRTVRGRPCGTLPAAAAERRPQRPGVRRHRRRVPRTGAARAPCPHRRRHAYACRRRKQPFYRHPAGLPGRTGRYAAHRPSRRALRSRVRQRSFTMSIAAPILAFLLISGFAAYHRMRLITWAVLQAIALAACWWLGAHQTTTLVMAIITAVIAVPLLLPFIRKPLIVAPLLNVFRKILPPLSQTERIALETGSVGFEGELFTGDPDWQKLLAYPKPQLTAEEQAFLDGPVEELCKMINDWELTHVHADLPPELWDFIKKNKFFGMIIPKEYGGLGFSALAHHKVIQKIASISSVVSSTVGVPNSLGPG